MATDNTETSFPLPSGTSLGMSRTSNNVPQQAEEYTEHEIELSATLKNTLRFFGQQHSVTLNCLVQGAWAILLSRYSREEDVLFGAIARDRLMHSNLVRADTEADIPINPVPVRIKVLPEVSVLFWLKNLEVELTQCNLHVYSSAQEIPRRNEVPDSPLLFESIVVLESYAADTASRNWLESRKNSNSSYSEKNSPISVVATLGPEFFLRVRYDRRRFDAAAMARVLGHLETLLEGMVANPERPITQIPFLTGVERHQLLMEWNDTWVGYPKDLCLHQLFEVQAQRTPGTVAVVFENQSITYQELNCRANQLAHRLIKLGVGPEVLVGICMERSLEMVVGLLGILKAGGAYVPLDPDYPRERLAFMLHDAQAPVLMTQERILQKLPENEARVLCLDRDWDVIAQENEETPGIEVTAENLAYVIYTSGSTGKPKGAMNTHRGICNRLLWMQDTYRLTNGDRVLQKTPFSFDVSVWEFFWPLMTGSCMVLARPRGHQDAHYLVQLIIEQQITVLHFVPSMLSIFLEEPNAEHCRSLRQVICSGEMLPLQLQQRFFTRLEAKLDNLYGPTEAAVDVTYWPCERSGTLGIVPIGRPVANTQIYILDSYLQPVPIGVSGELHIGGVQVGRGYLDRPELTAEKFIANLFSDEPGSRLYKTGDLARYLPDGNIEFLGRLDDQVKIRGNRIELGEIEAALMEHPGIQNATVVTKKYAPGDHRLVAYIVPKWMPRPELEEVRNTLKEKLPDYMMPSAFIFLESIPLNPNGKVDRKALPDPERIKPKVGKSYAAPRTEFERYLANLWCEILQIDQVGINDRFFEIGGNSLLGALFINKVQQKLGEKIYIVALFEAPTIAQFAAYLSANYAGAVSRVLGLTHPANGRSQETKIGYSEERRIDETDVLKMRQLVPSFEQHKDPASTEPKNPPAIFVLAPHRSGTTLLRAMLAGHPDLFAAPEPHLLGFATLQERNKAFQGKYSIWLEGTIRSIMEIKRCGPQEAKRLMEEYASKAFTTKEFFRVLQEWIAPKIFVDKSPLYALDPIALQRAEKYFDNALYIHLARHPYAVIRSFEDWHMDQVLFTREHNYTPRQLAELVWTMSHKNILEFLVSVPEERQYRIKFEHLTSRPQEVMEEMCGTLGLRFHPDLLQPYKDKEGKMTDGIYPESAPMGDSKFHKYQGIDPTVAEHWRQVSKDDFFGNVTWEVAELLGYERPTAQEDHTERKSSSLQGKVINPRTALLQRQRELRKEHRTAREKR